jgi:hypothetical protein
MNKLSKVSFLTSEKCNIFCRIDSCNDVVRYLKEHLIDDDELVITEQNNDARVVVKISNYAACIEFYILKRQKGGDKIAKTLLGAFNYFDKISTDAKNNKEVALLHLSKCNASIGIKAQPAFTEKFHHVKYLFGVVNEFNGMIFNGSGLIDGEGGLVLDADGYYSVIYESED